MHTETKQSAEFTHFVLPDATGRTVSGELGWVPGQTIHRGDVAEWPELNGWMVYRKEYGWGGKTNFRGDYVSGSCMYLYLSMRGRAAVARLAHNQEAVGSNPTPATNSLGTHEPDLSGPAGDGEIPPLAIVGANPIIRAGHHKCLKYAARMRRLLAIWYRVRQMNSRPDLPKTFIENEIIGKYTRLHRDYIVAARACRARNFQP